MKDDDFRRAVAGAVPLSRRRRAEPPRPRIAPVPAQTRRDERAVLEESLRGPWSPDDALDTGEALAHLSPGVSRQVLLRLRRGYWSVQDSLDLHGMNRIEAAASVSEFLRDCAARGLRCIRIVHGRGRGSKNREPVLKGKVRLWLAQREEVLAFCQAPAAHGGSGAVLVLLRG